MTRPGVQQIQACLGTDGGLLGAWLLGLWEEDNVSKFVGCKNDTKLWGTSCVGNIILTNLRFNQFQMMGRGQIDHAGKNQ